MALADGHLACGCGDGTIQILDPASGSCLAVFQGHQGWVRALAVHPRRALLVAGDGSERLHWLALPATPWHLGALGNEQKL
ncbi:MAG: hypothetical protein ACKOPN_06550 [Prochlorococcaceae cyanobacterium]